MAYRAPLRALLSFIVLLLLAGPSCALCMMDACSDCAAREEPEMAMDHSEGMPCHGADTGDKPGLSAAADECCAVMANAGVRLQAVATAAPAVDGFSVQPAALADVLVPLPRSSAFDAPDASPPRAAPPLYTLLSTLLL